MCVCCRGGGGDVMNLVLGHFYFVRNEHIHCSHRRLFRAVDKN